MYTLKVNNKIVIILLYIEYMNEKKIKKGTFLISQPLISDKRFKKTIILISESNKDGILGFVINQETNVKINELVKGFENRKDYCYYGGPVQVDNLFYFHQKGSIIDNSKKIFKNIYFGGDFNQIKEYIKSGLINESDIKFFLGYCGWEKKQLENELKEKSWVVINEFKDFFNEKMYWDQTLIEFDEEYKIWVNAKDDYHLN